MADVNKAAAQLGARGGASRSEAKASAARMNGQKGGRPKNFTVDELGVLCRALDSHQIDAEKQATAYRKAGNDDMFLYETSNAQIAGTLWGYFNRLRNLATGETTPEEAWKDD